MVELVLAEVFRLAAEYRDLENLGPAHSPSCEYMHRNPPIFEDCDCYAFRTHEELLAEMAELLVNKILSIDSRNAAKSGLEEWLGVTNPTHVPAIGKTV